MAIDRLQSDTWDKPVKIILLLIIDIIMTLMCICTLIFSYKCIYACGCMHYSQHPAKPKPHHDQLSPSISSPTTCTLSTTPASHLLANTTLTPTTLESSDSSSATTVSASGIVKSVVPENTSDKFISAASDVNEHEAALQNLRRRRLELKQQREQSSRRTDGDCLSAVEEEIVTIPISSHLPNQPPALVRPHNSQGRSSGYLGVDSTHSRLVDSNSSAHTSHPKGPTVSSSGPGNLPSSTPSKLSLIGGSRTESISTEAPVFTSSSESSMSQGKTSFTQYGNKLERFCEHLRSQEKTESEIDANPDNFLMKEGEMLKPQPQQSVSAECSHVDIPPSNLEQKFDQKSERERTEFENRGAVAVEVPPIQDDGKQQQTLTTNEVSIAV